MRPFTSAEEQWDWVRRVFQSRPAAPGYLEMRCFGSLVLLNGRLIGQEVHICSGELDIYSVFEVRCATAASVN